MKEKTITTRMYAATLEQDGAQFVITFPSFENLSTCADTIEEAREMAHDCLQLHIDGLYDDGDEIPAPFAVDTLNACTPVFDQKVAHFYVAINVPHRTPAERLDDACARIANIFCLDLYTMYTIPDGIGDGNLFDFIEENFEDAADAIRDAGMGSVIRDVTAFDEDIHGAVMEAFNNGGPHGFLAQVEVSTRCKFRDDGGYSIDDSRRWLRVIHGDTINDLVTAAVRFSAKCLRNDRAREMQRED